MVAHMHHLFKIIIWQQIKNAPYFKICLIPIYKQKNNWNEICVNILFQSHSVPHGRLKPSCTKWIHSQSPEQFTSTSQLQVFITDATARRCYGHNLPLPSLFICINQFTLFYITVAAFFRLTLSFVIIM